MQMTWGLVRSKTAPIHATQTGTITDLFKMATTHSVSQAKDGSGWCPADFTPGPRTGDRAGAWCVMVLDIEAKTENVIPGKAEAGKRVIGPLPPTVDEISAEIELQGWSCAVATSHSHEGPAEVGTLGPRYRLVLEVSRPIASTEIEPLGLHIADLLGLGDCLDTGCLESARLFYLPRCPQEREHLTQSASIEGTPLDVDALLTQKRIADAPAPQRKANQSASVIDAFNEQADVGQILEEFGYEPKSRNRWMFPHSSTGVAGVIQLPKTERIYSHHPNDPLYCKTHSHDSFSVWCVLKHGGNMAAAVREAAKLLGMERKKPDALCLDDLTPVSTPESDSNTAPDAKSDKPGFAFVKAADLLSDHSPTVYLLDELIEAQSLVLLFAPSGAGKSFVALAWSASIATGTAWLGRDVAKGPVFYLAGEGHAGIKRRLRAFELHTGHALIDAPLYVSKTPAALMDAKSAASVTQAIEGLTRAHGNPALIVIDTFARNMGNGDESSNADVGVFVNHIDLMKEHLKCSVMLVHHSGHMEAQRARGGSALPAAMDSIFRIDGKPDGMQLVQVKAKESEHAEPLALNLEQVPLTGWLDAKGREMTSAVVVQGHASDAGGRNASKPLTPRQQEAFTAYIDAAKQHGHLGADGDFAGVHRDFWREVFYGACAADNQAAKQKAFVRAMRDLVQLEKLSVKDDIFSLNGIDNFIYSAQIAAEIAVHKTNPDTDITRTLPGHCPDSQPSDPDRHGHTPIGVSGCPGDAMGVLQ